MCAGLFDNDAAEAAQRQAAAQRRELEAREAQRQQAILAGRESIDKAFSQFDDDFFTGYQDTYQSTLLPNLGDQYEKARAQLIAALTGRGVLESTPGATALANIQQKFDDTKVDIGNRAVDAANALRGKVSAHKSDLYSLNSQAADPALANTRAVGAASTLAAPPTVSPIGDVFANALQPFQAFASSYGNRAGPRYQSPYTSAARGNSGRVVN